MIAIQESASGLSQMAIYLHHQICCTVVILDLNVATSLDCACLLGTGGAEAVPGSPLH